MRNPYYIDVKMEQESGDIFQIAGQAIGKGTDTTKISSLLDEDDSQQTGYTASKSSTSPALNQISELPRGLKNYFHLVESQRQKLCALLRFIDSLSAKRLIIFFGTCASVNFHHQALRVIFSKQDRSHLVSKLHGKIGQKQRTKIYKKFRA